MRVLTEWGFVMSKFKVLSSVDVKGRTEKKGNLTYLSWAWAWAEACKVADVTRKVYETEAGLNYHTDGKTAWVKVGVTIDSIEHIDYLPVMDFKNKSIQLSALTSMDVNKAIQRSTTKALALHGLGLNVYAGEDLPITPKLPTDGDIRSWLGNGKTKDEVLNYVAGLGCDITTEFTDMVEAI
jgi:hypothetical protein